MSRVLPLLLACLLLLGLPLGEGELGAWLAATDAADHDCCPDRNPFDDIDCCDYELGTCCVASLAALPSVPEPVLPVRLTRAEPCVPLPPHALHRRATGPPPTPPPIG